MLRGVARNAVGLNDAANSRESGGNSPLAGVAPEIDRALHEKAVVGGIGSLDARKYDGLRVQCAPDPGTCGAHRFPQRRFRSARHHAHAFFAPRNTNFHEGFEEIQVLLASFVDRTYVACTQQRPED